MKNITKLHNYHETKLFDKSLYKINKTILKSSHINNNISKTNINKLANELYKLLNLVRFKYKKTYNPNSNIQVNPLFCINTNDETYIKDEKNINKNILPYEDKIIIIKLFINIIIHGIIINSFKDILISDIIIIKKKLQKNLSATNSRVIINNTNILKVVFKLIDIIFLNVVYSSGLVDTNIHVSKKVISKRINKPVMYNNKKKCYINNPLVLLNFCSIADIATELLNYNDVMFLDLSNAYNNLPYNIIYDSLFKKLQKIKCFNNIENLIKHIKDINMKNKPVFVVKSSDSCEEEMTDNILRVNTFDNDNDILEPDEIDVTLLNENNDLEEFNLNNCFEDIEQFKNNINENKNTNILTHNICFGIIKLIMNIKYKNPYMNNKILKRNKGVPQGASISQNIFIIVMDSIIKHCIFEFKTKLSLEHNIDYNLQIYVDDIAIKYLTDKAINMSTEIFNIIKTIMTKYNFKINAEKTLCSEKISNITGYNKIIGSDKYLGIYYEKDKYKYFRLIEKELQSKYEDYVYKNNIEDDISYMYSFDSIEENINKLKEFKYGINSLRGKLQFRLYPFCGRQRELRYKFMIDMGYPKIADLLFSCN